MLNIIQSAVFKRWFEQLRDQHVQARIDTRIRRLAVGNPGQVRDVGLGVSEMKLDFGPGWRVYYQRRGEALVVLLCGGNKSSQQSDIALAHRLAADWEKEGG